jgi:hypothetical protein
MFLCWLGLHKIKYTILRRYEGFGLYRRCSRCEMLERTEGVTIPYPAQECREAEYLARHPEEALPRLIGKGA